MGKYIIRLDDACEKRDIKKWDNIEKILDKYSVKPLVGIIPHCEDIMMDQYSYDSNFWNIAKKWENKGWTLALHGYNHKYSTNKGGLNPINLRSEFAGEPLKVQQQKIRDGINIMNKHGIEPSVFFAPSHTFDINTLEALRRESNIRIISDTISNNIYFYKGFYFIPQQSGRVRKLIFKITTFCYHPNMMDVNQIEELERFIKKHRKKFVCIEEIQLNKRKLSLYDKILRNIYFIRRGKFS